MNRIQLYRICLAIVSFILFIGSADAAINIVPNPFSVTEGGGDFTVPTMLDIYSDGGHSDSTLPWIIKLFKNAGKDAQGVSSSNGAHVIITFIPPHYIFYFITN